MTIETTSVQSNSEDRNRFFDNTGLLFSEGNVLTKLDGSLRKHGFAGSTSIPKLILLASYTALLDKPVSVVIKGTSGSGKSFSLQAGLRYLPTEAYVQFHGMSDKALVYATGLDLKHKTLVIQEAAGLAEGNGRAFLRQLLSEGSVSYLTVAKTSNGHEGRELQSVQGPTNLFMTTTANALHTEDETRMISVYPDQSSDQIRQALMMQALGSVSQPTKEELAQWHALYRHVALQNRKVIIPFKEAIIRQLPLTHHRILRDMAKVFSLIEAHALLEQSNRDWYNDHIKATPQDYEAVFDLVSVPLANGLHQSVPNHIRAVVEAVGALHAAGVERITFSSVADALQINLSTASRNLGYAIAEEYVVNHKPGKGRDAMLVPGPRALPNSQLLPSPDTLRI